MFKDKFNFNFWPSFTDLMLSLVLVMLIILFSVSKMISAGNENLDRARESQDKIYETINTEVKKRGYTVDKFDDRDLKPKNVKDLNADIRCIYKLDRMTITFSDKVLFDTGKSDIKSTGEEILSAVGPIIKNNLDKISEIQIQGHADIKGLKDSNLELASSRAMKVYKYLQYNIGIDPAEHLMSATSFGQYKPVGREAGDVYSAVSLDNDNSDHDKRARNRRIEIVLTFDNAKKQQK